METTTPKAITDPIRSLCAKLVADSHPTFIAVVPEVDAAANDCFVNVSRKIEAAGGKLVYGWAIWEWPEVLVEAEFHAVWESPEGACTDITPKMGGEAQILFLADPARKWTGQYIDNVRKALRPSRLLDDLDAISKRLVHLYNRSEKTKDGIAINAHELGPIEELKAAITELLRAGGNHDSKCPCRSGRKYKNCHRKILYP